MVNANIAFDEALVFECEPTLQNGELLAEQLLEAGVDAAYVAGDELAIGLLNGIINADVSVPEEFEVTASNNSRITEMARPKLTSIMLPLYDIGAVAMRLLTKIMNKEEIDEKSIILPYKIVNRGTTLPKK